MIGVAASNRPLIRHPSHICRCDQSPLALSLLASAAYSRTGAGEGALALGLTVGPRLEGHAPLCFECRDARRPPRFRSHLIRAEHGKPRVWGKEGLPELHGNGRGFTSAALLVERYNFAVAVSRLMQVARLSWCRVRDTGDLTRRDRTREEETLSLVAAVLCQEPELLLCFHAFGDDLQAKAVRHGNDGLGDRRVVLVARQARDERPVDFQHIDR